MEIAVALAVAAVVMTLARAILASVSDGADRIARAAAERDNEASTDQLLRSVLASASGVDGDSVAFMGTERSAFFRAWCASAGGWAERCNVGLVVADSSPTVSLHFENSRQFVVVRTGRFLASLCYLKSADNGGTWLPEWPASRAMPIAIGIVIDADTTIVPVGG